MVSCETCAHANKTKRSTIIQNNFTFWFEIVPLSLRKIALHLYNVQFIVSSHWIKNDYLRMNTWRFFTTWIKRQQQKMAIFKILLIDEMNKMIINSTMIPKVENDNSFTPHFAIKYLFTFFCVKENLTKKNKTIIRRHCQIRGRSLTSMFKIIKNVNKMQRMSWDIVVRALEMKKNYYVWSKLDGFSAKS